MSKITGWASYRVGQAAGMHVYVRKGQIYFGLRSGGGFTISKLSPEAAALLGATFLTAVREVSRQTSGAPEAPKEH